MKEENKRQIPVEFLYLARDLRRAQKEFARLYNPAMLDAAKRYEKQFDKELDRLLRQERHRQADLCDGILEKKGVQS